MEEILRRNPKVLVDSGLQGVVPLLNLGEGARVPAAVAPQLTRPAPAPQQQGFQGNPNQMPARPQGVPR
jgi:hypothetical protein